MRFAVFPDQATYDTWHSGVKTALGLTDQNSPYAYTLTHLFDPVTYPQVLARIDNNIDLTGLTIWEESAAMNNGFLDSVPFVAAKIAARKEFWNKLVDEYSASNQIQGITLDQTNHVVTRLKDLLILGLSGALETLLSELQAMAPDDFTQPEHWITQAQLDANIAAIQAYLAEE